VTLDSGTAALFGALIGAAAGIGAQFLIARNGREQAKTAREQARMERTYEDVMTTVNRSILGVERTEPVWSWEGAPGPPPPMTDDDVNALNARIGLYGSDAVRDSLTEFSHAERRFYAAVGLLRDMKVTATTGLAEQRQKVDADREAVHDLRRQIEGLARSDLRR